MADVSIDVLVNDRAVTGESPMWSGAEGALYWIDGRRDAIYRIVVASGVRTQWTTPSRVNAVARADGGLVVALKSGIARLDIVAGTFTHLALPDGFRADMRMNDGKVDRAGRFWFGTMHDEAAEPIGNIHRLDPDGTLATLDGGYGIPNGFAWSPDDRRLYLADSQRRRIDLYDVDMVDGTVSGRRPFAETPPATMPDGATTDAAGYLWSACVGGGAIVRYAPSGEIDRRVALPVTRPTSVIFGGDDLRTLFVTSASRNLSPDELAQQPLAGAVFAVRVDVPGLPEPSFGG